MSLSERWFGLTYDPIARVLERRIAEHRRWLAAGLSGTVLDLGCGSGLQFQYLALEPEVERVIGVEPNDRLRRKAAERASDLRLDVELREGVGEELPLEDASVDGALSVMVLCSVDDPAAVLSEIERVVRPGGAVRLLEHVRDDGVRGRFQQAVQPLWGRLSGGCHLTRRSDSLVAGREDLDVVILERSGPSVPLARPFVRGRLRRRQ